MRNGSFYFDWTSESPAAGQCVWVVELSDGRLHDLHHLANHTPNWVCLKLDQHCMKVEESIFAPFAFRGVRVLGFVWVLGCPRSWIQQLYH